MRVRAGRPPGVRKTDGIWSSGMCTQWDRDRLRFAVETCVFVGVAQIGLERRVIPEMLSRWNWVGFMAT